MTHRVVVEDERHDAGLQRRSVDKWKLERDGGSRGGHRLERVGARSNGILAEPEVIVVLFAQSLVQADGPDDLGVRRFCTRRFCERMQVKQSTRPERRTALEAPDVGVLHVHRVRWLHRHRGRPLAARRLRANEGFGIRRIRLLNLVQRKARLVEIDALGVHVLQKLPAAALFGPLHARRQHHHRLRQEGVHSA